MSFSIDTYGLPAIESYADALKKWNNTKPWRGYSDDHPRPLDRNRAKKHMTIYLDPASEDIRLHLHSTDVVIYHKDGSITLNPYTSVSTDKFANDLLPHDLLTHFNHSEFYIVTCGTRWGTDSKHYSIPSSGMRFIKGACEWLPMGQCGAMIQYKVNRKQANIVTKATGFDQFKAWYEAVVAMSDVAAGNNWVGKDVVLRWLGNRGDWPEIAAWVRAKGMDTLRDLILKRYSAIDEIAHPYADTATLAAITRSHAKWHYI